jgi:two-component sensor histidine kinase
LVLALHELGTNALKHGALSTPEGRVDLSWDLHDTQLVLRWVERLGPPVEPPSRKGLGTRLLSSQPGLDRVKLQYLVEGLHCTITIDGARPANQH